MSVSLTKQASLSIQRLLSPSSIAVVGASEDQTKFGGRLLRMLLKHGYQGTVFPVNPKRDTLFNLKSYASIDALPHAPDLVVMTVPNHKVKEQIEAAGKRGTACAIIISAGFSDAGEEGAALEREVVELADSFGMRLIGPNCLGVISAVNKIVLCSSPILEIEQLPCRPIGFVSQSGALMTTYFDRAWDQGGGFSHGISVGNQADLELCDFVDFLIDDPDTKVICTYIEGLKDATRFRQTARRARAAGKPWLTVKAGRSSAGSAAAFSHTASVAGDHAVFASVCRDEGITLMNDLGAMLVLANTMADYPDREVSSVAIVTPSGGSGALATDALAEHGMRMAQFGPETQMALGRHFPGGQANNPVDFGARKTDDPVVVAQATMNALHADPDTDVILVTAAMCPREWMDQLVHALPIKGAPDTCPVLFALDAGKAHDYLREQLAARGQAYANSSAEAVLALSAWHEREWFLPRRAAQRPTGCRPLDSSIQGVLDEASSKGLLEQYGIPANVGVTVSDREEAVQAAERIGFPVVMKIVSPDIVHKTEAGGVALNVPDAAAVQAAYDRLNANARKAVPDARIEGVSVQAMAKGDIELFVGARNDPLFGPVMVFGAGGILVELLPERVVACAPLHPADVLRMLESLSIGSVLSGYRGRSLDLQGVVDIIVRASWLAHDLSGKDFELDINPLIVAADRCFAVDARLKVG